MQTTLGDTAPDTAGSTSEDRFDELKPKTGQTLRLIFPTTRVECVYVHTLEAPVVIDGVIQWETKNRKDKSTYRVYETRFLGRKICLGDPEYQSKHGGLDPRACPACQAAQDGIAELIPEPRYAVPVIVVSTDRNLEPQDPPNAKVYVLSLTERQYTALTKAIASIRDLYDWPPAHPVKPSDADLILECEDGDWRRFNWKTPKRPCWAKTRNPALNAYIGALWKNPGNRPTETQLQLACGRISDLRWMSKDTQEVVDAYALVKSIETGGNGRTERSGGQPAEHAQADGGSLSAELDDLDSVLGDDLPAGPADGPGTGDLSGLDEFAPREAASGNGHAETGEDLISGEPAGAPAAADGPGDDLFGEDSAPPAAAPEPAAATAATAAAPEDAASFDAILDDL